MAIISHVVIPGLSPAMAQAGVAIEPQATFHAPHEVFIPSAVVLA